MWFSQFYKDKVRRKIDEKPYAMDKAARLIEGKTAKAAESGRPPRSGAREKTMSRSTSNKKIAANSKADTSYTFEISSG